MGLLFDVLGAALGVSSSAKTKSYYANKIAQEERILASWKAALATKKDDYSRRELKALIERQKGLIASLKAEMKAAPKG